MCSQSRVARRQALERCSRWPYGEERGFSSNLSAAPQHWNRQFWQQEDVYPYREKGESIVDAFRSSLEQRSPPDRLYHYTTGAGLGGILQSGTLWLTDIFALNDPSELRHSVDHAIDLLRLEARRGHQAAVIFANQFAEIMADAPSSVAHMFVASFSQHCDDLGQWRPYSDDGRGFALEFDRDRLERSFVMPGGHSIESNSTFPMTYDDAVVKGICTDLIRSVVPLIAMPHGRNLSNGSINDFMKVLSMHLGLFVLQTALYFKHEAYNYEAEYRFLQLRAIGAPLNDLKLRGSKSSIRYAEFPWARLDPTALRRIVVGPSADYPAAKLTAAAHLSAAGLSTVDITRSLIPYRG
jgi:hypothetical protein